MGWTALGISIRFGWADVSSYRTGEAPMAQAGSTMAILAAVLFGISTPLAKLLVHDLSP